MRLISRPVLCNYYVTYRCNASCSFCDLWEKPSPYVSLENVKSNLHSLKKMGVKVVDFTGGEPLLHRELHLFCQLAKEMGFITTVTTNALLYPKFAEKLHGHVDMLHFSLDASDADKHDTLRGVKCFDKVMESIQVAKKLGERPDIIFTAFEDNLDELEKVYHEVCLPNDLVLIINPAFDYSDLHVKQSRGTEQLEALRKWGKKKLVYLNEGFIDLRLDGGNKVKAPVCKAGTSTVVISPENELVVPCYHLSHKSFPIQNSLKETWDNSEVKMIRELEGRMPECEGCVVNCYMQPSFAVELNKYWFKALKGTIKYNRIKGTWKQLVKM